MASGRAHACPLGGKRTKAFDVQRPVRRWFFLSAALDLQVHPPGAQQQIKAGPAIPGYYTTQDDATHGPANAAAGLPRR